MKVGASPLSASRTQHPTLASASAGPLKRDSGRGRLHGQLLGGPTGAEMSSFLSRRPPSLFPQALKWQLSPLTIVSWLNVYMQVAYLNDMYEVLLPQYPQHVFIQIAEVGAQPGVPAPIPAPAVARGGVWPLTQRSVSHSSWTSACWTWAA